MIWICTWEFATFHIVDMPSLLSYPKCKLRKRTVRPFLRFSRRNEKCFSLPAMYLAGLDLENDPALYEQAKKHLNNSKTVSAFQALVMVTEKRLVNLKERSHRTDKEKIARCM